MTLDIENHLLVSAEFLPSPNHSERPNQSEISLLVIHNISLPPGEFGGDSVAELFCNALDCTSHPYFESLVELKVSAHLFIDRSGEVIQFVPFDSKAWHAGASQYEGQKNCNDFSIGIEMEGTDDEPFTDAQYAQLTEVTRALLASYPKLSAQRIVGHSDIAPGRKTDPGPCFDWNRYIQSLDD